MWYLVSNCPLCETYHLLPVYSTDLYSPSRKPYFRSHNRAVSLERSERGREPVGGLSGVQRTRLSSLLPPPPPAMRLRPRARQLTSRPTRVPKLTQGRKARVCGTRFKLPPHRPQSASLKAGCPEATRSAPHPDTQHPYPSRTCTEP